MSSTTIKPGPSGGLKVSTATYQRLQAFQGGGAFWDHQDLICRELGEFLPPVEQQMDAGVRVGIFRSSHNGKEILANSRTARQVSVPADQIDRLRSLLEKFKQQAQLDSTEPNARTLINQFRLPDFTKDPELYRLCGPWWNRRLQVIWGCERLVDSSLPPLEAINTLPIDRVYRQRIKLSAIGLFLLALALLGTLILAWPHLQHCFAKLFNEPPVAAAKLDGLDLTNRVATVSDTGSRDPDGSIAFWEIAWGDGQLDHVTNTPASLRHAYSQDGTYTISYACADILGATSAPPVTLSANFDLERRLADLDAAQREADSIKKKAAQEAEQQAAQIIEAAKKAEAQAKQEREAAEAAKAQAAQEQEKAREAQAAAEKAKTEAANGRTEPHETSNSPAGANKDGATSADGALPVGPDPNAPWTNSPAKSEPKQEPKSQTKPNRPDSDQVKGGEALLQSLNAVEIQKSTVGKLDSKNRLEAILVVRDTVFPNAPLQVLSWEINGQTETTGNAQYTVRLPVGTHKVRVTVIRSSLKKTASADVVVSAQQVQSQETSLQVIPTN